MMKRDLTYMPFNFNLYFTGYIQRGPRIQNQ